MIKGWLDPVIASKIHFTRGTKDMAAFIDKSNMQNIYGGDDKWEYWYPEPVPGENPKLGNKEGRAPIDEARMKLAEEFTQETIAWAARDASTDEGKDKSARRDEVIERLKSNYWELDPYIRATTYLYRVGVVNDKGEVDFKGAKTAKA